MILFSVIVLTLIIVGSTHVVNYVARLLWKDDIAPLCFLVQIVQLAIILPCVYYIILWGSKLL